ncbi:hypothetical protein BV22DRAFT_1134610 [Leucogyrophana mollusca]|uniref:Uncharacterized protein n=1 Tax=Leucogyrophana mollusca TaxID=85980 RepID=A0ACB8AY00_9AGAM|nr:hypothetical protein BV22DRAFT_1134610 [Leucogyrophana mollusca]
MKSNGPTTAELLTTLVKGSRGPQAVEVYSKMVYATKIKPLVDQAQEDDEIAGKDLAKFCRATTKEMFENEDEELQEKVREKAAEMRKALAAKKAALKAPVDLTPEQIQAVIDDLPALATNFMKGAHRASNWSITVLMGGIDPSRGGKLRSGSLHIGPDGQPTFSESYVGFNRTMEAFDLFLKQIYAPDAHEPNQSTSDTQWLDSPDDGAAIGEDEGGDLAFADGSVLYTLPAGGESPPPALTDTSMGSAPNSDTSSSLSTSPHGPDVSVAQPKSDTSNPLSASPRRPDVSVAQPMSDTSNPLSTSPLQPDVSVAQNLLSSVESDTSDSVPSTLPPPHIICQNDVSQQVLPMTPYLANSTILSVPDDLAWNQGGQLSNGASAYYRAGTSDPQVWDMPDMPFHISELYAAIPPDLDAAIPDDASDYTCFLRPVTPSSDYSKTVINSSTPTTPSHEKIYQFDFSGYDTGPNFSVNDSSVSPAFSLPADWASMFPIEDSNATDATPPGMGGGVPIPDNLSQTPLISSGSGGDEESRIGSQEAPTPILAATATGVPSANSTAPDTCPPLVPTPATVVTKDATAVPLVLDEAVSSLVTESATVISVRDADSTAPDTRPPVIPTPATAATKDAIETTHVPDEAISSPVIETAAADVANVPDTGDAPQVPLAAPAVSASGWRCARPLGKLPNSNGAVSAGEEVRRSSRGRIPNTQREKDNDIGKENYPPKRRQAKQGGTAKRARRS